MKRSLALLALSLALSSLFGARFARGPIDPRLVGVWEGSTSVSESETRSWIQTRRADGTVSTTFTERQGNEIVDVYETHGLWWVRENRFYETFDDAKEPADVYEFAFLDDRTLRFVQLKDDALGDDFEPYSFIETRSDAPLAP